MALLKFSLKTNIVKSIFTEIFSNVSHYFYVFGKNTEWPTVVDTEDGETILVSDETTPPAPIDSYSYEIETRRNMIYAKAIDSNDACIIVKRYNWTPGYTYDMYDDYSADRPAFSGATSLDQAVFYVLTADFNVYKCLFNNNDGPSIDQPIGVSSDAFITPDNYIWKFMYTVPLYLRNKFLTSSWLPVTTALSNQFYSNGSVVDYSIEYAGAAYSPNTWKVKRFLILDGGSSYTTNSVTITFPNPPAGGTVATAVVNSVGDLGKIISIAVTNPGSGYTVQPVPTVTTTAGIGLEFEIEYDNDGLTKTELVINGDGYNEQNPYSLKTITILDRGIYSAQPSGSLFTFSPPQRSYGKMPWLDVTFRPIGTSGLFEVDTITVLDQGYGYTSPLIFNQNVFAGPLASTTNYVELELSEAHSFAIGDIITQTNNAASGVVKIESTNSTTVLIEATGVFTTDPVAYLYKNSVLLSPNTICTTVVSREFNCDLNSSTQKNQAIIIPLIGSNGEVQGLNVVEPGIGYTYASVDLKMYKQLDPLDPYSVAEILEGLDISDPRYVAGFRKAVISLNFGIGDIETKQSTVELLAVNGSIQVIVVENQGIGYTSSATIDISGDGTGAKAIPIVENGNIVRVLVTNQGAGYSYATATVSDGGTAAELRVIISPKGGHGRDAVAELMANTIKLTNRLGLEKMHGIQVNSDYRQISILKNPYKYGEKSHYRNSTGTTSIAFICGIGSDNTVAYTNYEIGTSLNLLSDSSKTFTLIEKSIKGDKYYLVATVNDNFIPSAGNTISNGAYSISISAVSLPNIDKYTGEILYIDNRIKFASSDEQTIVTSTLISF